MRSKEVDGDLTVLCNVGIDLAALQDHLQDVRIDLDVFCHEHAQTRKINRLATVIRAHLLPVCVNEFFNDVRREQRLCQEAVDAALQCLFKDVIPSVCREDYDRGFIAYDLPYPLRCLHTVKDGHLPVNEDEVIGLVTHMAELDHLYSFLAARSDLGRDPGLLENESGMFACDRIVIDDEDRHLARMDVELLLDSAGAVGIRERNGDGKGGALALLAFDVDRAVHHLDYVLGDGKAEAG